MAQPKFFLQPLAAAICVACYSTAVFADDLNDSKKTCANYGYCSSR